MSSKNGWASVPTGTGAIGVPRRRRVAPIAGVSIAAMLVAIGLPLTATTASAVVRPAHIINVFPSRDAVNATGYAIGTSYTVNVLRGGALMGTSLAVARSNLSPAGVAEGWLDINEPVKLPDGSQTIECWGTGPGAPFVTPDIRPGDVVQVVDGASIDSTIVAGVTLNPTPATAYNAAAGTLTLTGTAPGATLGSRLPVLELEARVNAKNTKFSALNGGAASIRALNLNLKPGEGKLDYDNATGDTWTATFTNMNALGTGGVADGTRAMASIQAGVWSLVTLTESTSSERGGVPAPAKGPLFGAPGCSAPAMKGPTKPMMTAGDTGVLGDFITSNPKPTFTGSLGMQDSTSVSLFVGGVLTPSTSTLAGGGYSITPTTALTAGAPRIITVGETGPTAGAMLTGTTSSSVTIDLTPPAVTGIFPTTTGTTMAGNVTATFNENLDPSTVTTANFTLKNAAGTAVPATPTFNPVTKVFTIDPFASLVAGTTYTATLTAGITDAAGNPLAVQSWSFTTATSLVASYINRVYFDLFNRTPDATGLAGWTAKLNSGTPRVAVANAITSSAEYRSKLITGSYSHYLGRTPDPVGLAGWLAAMNRGITVSQMESGFIASDEYFGAAGGANANWVVKLYADVLGRTASPTDVAAWSAQLDSGTSNRTKVAMGFLLSSERLGTVVDSYYQKLLGRNLDATGRATWVRQLQAGVHNETIIGNIIASDEYYAKS